MKFYFEGRNAAGKAVVANGELDSPNIMLIIEEDAYREAEKHAGARAPAARTTRTRWTCAEGPGQASTLGRGNKEKIGLDTRYGKRKWWIGIGVGSGYGYAKGNGLEAVNASPETTAPPELCRTSFTTRPGAGRAAAHLAPEFGYQLIARLGDLLEGRFQYIPQPAKY